MTVDGIGRVKQGVKTSHLAGLSRPLFFGQIFPFAQRIMGDVILNLNHICKIKIDHAIVAVFLVALILFVMGCKAVSGHGLEKRSWKTRTSTGLKW